MVIAGLVPNSCLAWNLDAELEELNDSSVRRFQEAKAASRAIGKMIQGFIGCKKFRLKAAVQSLFETKIPCIERLGLLKITDCHAHMHKSAF